MFNILLQILGVIAIINWLLVLFWNVAIYIWYKLKQDTNYVGIRKNMYFFNTEANMWYIIPTIAIRIENNITSIEFTWLKWILTFSYSILTEEKETAEFKAMQELNKEK
jgi:hypothetical protein